MDSLFKRLLDFTRDGVYRYAFEDGRILFANQGLVEILDLDCGPDGLVGRCLKDVLIYTEQEGNIRRALESNGEIHGFEYHFKTLKGEDKWVLHDSRVVVDPETGEKTVEAIVKDITARMKEQREREASIEFLHLAGESRSLEETVRKAAAFFQEKSGCGAVGIRLKAGNDYPYYEVRGFQGEFVRMENFLCPRDAGGNPQGDPDGRPELECMCGNVIQGRFDPTKPFFTANGSFWTNSTTELLASTTETGRTARTCNRCNGAGYESVALIPLRAGDERLGIVQLNDPGKGRFTPEAIALWERLAGYLAVAIAKAQAEEALRESEERFRSLFENAVLGLYRTTTDGRIILANPALCRMLGYASLEDLAGRNLEINGFAPGHPRSDFIKAVQEKGVVVGLESRWKRADGSYMFVRESARAIRDASGGVVLYDGTVEDMTERKMLDEALHRRLGELQTLNRLSTALRAANTLEEMLPILLDETLTALEAAAGAIWLFDAARGELLPAGVRGWLARIDEPPLKSGEGLAGAVFAGGEAHLSREFARDPLIRTGTRPSIPAGWGGVGVPIRAAEEVIGTLIVSVPLPREIMPEEVHLLKTLTEMAGSAIHRMRLHAGTERHLKNLQALHAIDHAISGTLDVQHTLQILLDKVLIQLQADAADVLLLSPMRNVLEFAAGRGFRDRISEPDALRMGEGFAGRAAKERRTIVIPDIKAVEGDDRAALLARQGFTACVVVALVAKGQVKGVLEVFRRAPLSRDPEWLDFLDLLAGQAAIAIDNAGLYESVQRSHLELALAYDATIEGWARALELRDKETEGHTRRVADLTQRVAQTLGLHDGELLHIRRGALLHDIGKMAVPDRILLKPGKLTRGERELIRRHPDYAYRMLSPIAFLHPALDIPYCHHEKWDGSGYPRGLKDGQIPIAARIFAIVDVWDALQSDRPYRSAWSLQRTRQYICDQTGKHFDPQIVDTVLRIIDDETNAGPGDKTDKEF